MSESSLSPITPGTIVVQARWMYGSREAFLGSMIKKKPQTFAVCGFFINFAAKFRKYVF
jgi:hypothetical protein